ncbi:Trp biosynthesis-associated membrane protein [Actinopolymorpha sp. B17G11]|uniref:Trp biosynthesis-associated membrane protein n=1 Tax=unclassified Actinopolymorpha TaxID=2627063 RepID=UPI0032D95BE6
MTPRREMTVALVLVLAGAALALFAAGRTWVSAEWAVPDYPAVRVMVGGVEAAPLVRAAGLVGLAGLLAVLATRRSARRIVGVVLVLTGVAMVAACVAFWLQDSAIADNALATAVGDPTLTVHASARATSGWPVAGCVAGVLVTVGGLSTALGGSRWPAMGSRYDAPGGSGVARSTRPAHSTRPDGATESSRATSAARATGSAPPERSSHPVADDAWAALDRGEDPTTRG